MEVRGVLVFLAVAVAAVSAATEVTFPEVARERSSSRIVSGWEAEDGQFPFQLSVRMVSPAGAVSSCGGTIIHSEWGLTAAHCTAGRVTMVLRAGVVNLTLPDTIFETTRYYNHPLYNEAIPSIVQPHDIGLLEFGRALIFNDYVQPIRMQRSASKNVNYEGVQLTASGWGRTWTNGPAPENLNWVYLRGDTNQRCFQLYGTIIVDSSICASGYNVTSQSTCSGDSGGPLTAVDDDGAISQVGIASFVSGSGCHTDFPAGFIRPGHYHDWFTEVSGIDFDWEYVEPSSTVAPSTPSAITTESATDVPTDAPTIAPSTPSAITTESATDAPTIAPSTPSAITTESATDAPTDAPTIAPSTTSAITTESATDAPTIAPSTPSIFTTESATDEAPEGEEIACEDKDDEEGTRVYFVNN